MISREIIAQRLERFEILAGLEYKTAAVEIWLDRFRDYEVDRFCKICSIVEDRIKYHILPTLHDFLTADPEPLHPGTNIPEKYFKNEVTDEHRKRS